MKIQTESIKHRIFTFVRNGLLSGLLVWIPLLVTAMVMSFVIELLNSSLNLLPKSLSPDIIFKRHVPGLGVILSITVLLVTGLIARNYFGRHIVSFSEKLLERIPLVRSIYSGVKQIVETVFSPGGQAFRNVLLVEWPKKDMWSIAFQTTDVSKKVSSCLELADAETMVNVFVPATPNITSGFLMMVEKNKTKKLNMPVDEALKLVVSLGVVVV